MGMRTPNFLAVLIMVLVSGCGAKVGTDTSGPALAQGGYSISSGGGNAAGSAQSGGKSGTNDTSAIAQGGYSVNVGGANAVGGTQTGNGGSISNACIPASSEPQSTPVNHRSTDTPCSEQRAAGMTFDPEPQDAGCAQDSDCDAGINGRCLQIGFPFPGYFMFLRHLLQ